MVDGISGNKFNDTYNVKLQNRGKQSGITFEMKSIFSQMEQSGLIKDAKGDGFSKKDAAGLFEALKTLQQQKGYDTNYTKMTEGQSFEYSKDDMIALAQAAGYDIVGDTTTEETTTPEVTTPEASTTETTTPIATTPEATTPVDTTPVDTTPETTATEQKVPDDAKILEREVDGEKQRVAVYKENGQTVRKLVDENGNIKSDLVQTSDTWFTKKKFATPEAYAKQQLGLSEEQQLPKDVKIEVVGGKTVIFKKDGKILTSEEVRNLVKSSDTKPKPEVRNTDTDS